MGKTKEFQGWFYRLQASPDWLLLGLWIVIGAGVRFAELTAKSPWTDEFATMVFSLGNDFYAVPLDSPISPAVLLQPLRPNPQAGIGDVVSFLLNEDNHPPLYFILSHLWLKLFPPIGEYLSLWGVRSLSALFGVLSIPAIYFLGKIAFHSRLVGQLSAAMMAVSPYGVFIAQEARHYTLAILFVIISLGFIVVAARRIKEEKTISFQLVFWWILINILGLFVHYFFCLTILAEAITITIFWFLHYQRKRFNPKIFKNLWRLIFVAVGTIATGLAWIFVILPRGYGHGMTEWTDPGGWNILTIISPWVQLLAAWITMLSLLPVESSSLVVVILSGAVMLAFFIWAFPLFKRGWQANCQQPHSRLATGIFSVFWGSAIALFLGITYSLSMDITRGARYSFVYFPAIIVLVGASLATCWKNASRIKNQSPMLSASGASLQASISYLFNRKRRSAVIIVWLMGLLGTMTVIGNLGYKKYYLPDRLLAIMEENSSVPVLIATTHQSLVQTGEMMGIAWELTHNSSNLDASFLLAASPKYNSSQATLILQRVVKDLPRPLDVWVINFRVPVDLKDCLADGQSFPYINGYEYQKYHCQ
jgi:uncharacterized membrane protein